MGSLLTPAISFRPALDDDHDPGFLLRVYASTRDGELAPVPWTGEQKQAFLVQQFEAQTVHYRANYPGATFLVIKVDERDAGRLYVWRAEQDIRVMDISLLPEARGRGVGTKILRDLIAEAGASGRTLSIHVEQFNPAMSLYQRLGFRVVREVGAYNFLVKDPAEARVEVS